MNYVVVVGDPFDGGMELYGPFDTLKAAQDFHEVVGLTDGFVEFEYENILHVKAPTDWEPSY